MSSPELVLSLAAGICLSAAVGFRIFLPFLVMSLAARAGLLDLSGEFTWLASTPALLAFATAATVEILAYFIPWIDHLLDLVSGPVAVIAGVIATAAVVGDVSPLLKWLVAVIAGGGVAGAVQGGTTLLRGASTATTAGAGNPAVSAAEAGGATAASLLGVFLPLVGAVLVLGILGLTLRAASRWRRRRRAH